MKSATWKILTSLLLVLTICGCVPSFLKKEQEESLSGTCVFSAVDTSSSSGGRNGLQFQNYLQALAREWDDPACGATYALFRIDENVESDDVILSAYLPEKETSEFGLACAEKGVFLQKQLNQTLKSLKATAPGSDLPGLLFLMKDAAVSEDCRSVTITVYSDLFIKTNKLNTNFLVRPLLSPKHYFHKHFSADALPKFPQGFVKNFTVVRHTQNVEQSAVAWTEALWREHILPTASIPKSVVHFKLSIPNKVD